MDLAAILLELAKHPLDKIMESLPKGSGTVYQAIFDKGHGVAQAKATTEETRLKAAIASAEADRDAAVEKANKAGGSDATLKSLRDEHDRIIDDLKNQHKKTMQALKDEVTSERKDLAAEEFHSSLLAKGVEPDYAAVQKEKHKSRLRFAKDGALEIVQEGKDIPFAASSRKEAIGMLVEEVVKGTPAKFMVSTASSGSGAGEGEATNTGTGSTGKAFFDGIRTKAEAERKGTETAPRRTLDDAFPAGQKR